MMREAWGEEGKDFREGKKATMDRLQDGRIRPHLYKVPDIDKDEIRGKRRGDRNVLLTAHKKGTPT